MTVTSVPQLTDADVRERLTVPALIDALADVVASEHAGTAQNIPKTMAAWDGRSAHALGARDSAAGVVAFKTWVFTPDGAAAVMTVFDASDGQVLAVLDAGALGAFRTAAASGLATRLMSDPDADELAIAGTGRQALRQVEAVQAVRPLRRVRVWSPREASREEFATTVSTELGLQATACATIEEAVDGAPLVTLITRATQPFLRRGVLAPGAHLNAVGAILPANAEFNADVLTDADLVAVDNLDNARQGSRELREAYGDGGWGRVVTLGALQVGEVARPGSPRMTVFKGMGMGLSDLAAVISLGLVPAGVRS